jgi:ferredoxin
MSFTGALKNQYGLLPGSLKAEYHYRMKTREWLAEFVIDINRAAPLKLAIMDAVVGMEGNGPSGGEPREIGCIMASADLTALDAVACRMVGIDAAANPILSASAKRAYGVIDPAKIETIGVDPAELAISDFKIIKENINILRLLPLPGPAIEWLRQHWKALPEIDPDKCIKCMNCRDGCPLSPPAIDPDKAWQVDKSTCIKCYCCHEFCPIKAIKLEPTWFERHINLDPLAVFVGKAISFVNRFKRKKH